jgi:hypothetical protein
MRISDSVTKHPKDDLPTIEEVRRLEFYTIFLKLIKFSLQEELISINSKLTTLQLTLELLSKFCLECFSQGIPKFYYLFLFLFFFLWYRHKKFKRF